MKILKIAIVSFIGLLAVLGAAAAFLWHEYDRFVHYPADPAATSVVLEIPTNESLNSVARRLKEAGIVTDVLRFKLLARLKGLDKQLKAGEFRLSASMTPPEILDVLVNGEVVLHRLTVPEGYTIREIAMELKRIGLGNPDDFLALASDPQMAAEFDIQAATLEGYLFPDTYFFPKGVTARTIITQMIHRFQEQFTDSWRLRTRELNMTVHQVVTLASIIEKETGNSAERPIISSVFHNRLKKKMRLESDPTVIYGLKNFDGNITRLHLMSYTPYNTYIIRGLPPGPIANPGRLSLEAALYPADTDYLYFVSKKDGTHYFSKTIQEHHQAIRRYQLLPRKK